MKLFANVNTNKDYSGLEFVLIFGVHFGVRVNRFVDRALITVVSWPAHFSFLWPLSFVFYMYSYIVHFTTNSASNGDDVAAHCTVVLFRNKVLQM